MLGTSVGFLVFLLMLLAAVQILFHLHATSMVTAAAVDAARAVAGHDAGDDRCGAPAADAESTLREALGDYARRGRVELTWTCDPDVVRLRIRAVHPSLLPDRVRAWFSLGPVDRTIETRVERAR